MLLVTISLAAALTADDCKGIKIPTDPSSNLPMFTVRFSGDAAKGQCTVECDPHPTNTSKLVMSCMGFGDGVHSTFVKASLYSEKTCQQTMIEVPNKEPKSNDPESIFTSCPDWFLYMGWDRDQKRTLGKARQELVLKTAPALAAFTGAFPPSAASPASTAQNGNGLTEQDCAGIHVPTDPDSKLPIFAVRFSESEQTCTVECDPHPAPGSKLVLSCMDFEDAIMDTFKSKGPVSATCLGTSIEAPDKAPETIDPEMFVNSCPEWFLYSGWDRNFKRTLGNARKELVLKSQAALTTFKGIYKNVPSPLYV